MEDFNESNKWHLSLDIERQFWKSNVIGTWIDTPKNICPSCSNKSLRLANRNKITNPCCLKCNKRKCSKKVSLRENTIFQLFNKVPISVLIKIIELFVIENKNGIEIIKTLKEFYHVDSVNNKMVYNVLHVIRKYLAQYLKEVFYNPMIDKDEGGYVAVDESLFSHFHDGTQIWFVGLINTRTQYFRIEAVLDRSATVLERIIRHHVGKGNNVVTDGWSGYDWMNSVNSG